MATKTSLAVECQTRFYVYSFLIILRRSAHVTLQNPHTRLQHIPLLHRDRLCQIPWLVHVEPAQGSDMVRQ